MHTACQPTCFAPHMLISSHIFIMPQWCFKFKLCRLARSLCSLDSLPIIQLLLLLPFPLSFPSQSIFHSIPSICCLLFSEKLSHEGELSNSVFFSPPCPCENSQEKVSHILFIYIFRYDSPSIQYSSLFWLSLLLIGRFYFPGKLNEISFSLRFSLGFLLLL